MQFLSPSSFDILYFSSDYVYFENSSSNPYLIRRIEELNKVGRSTLCCWVTGQYTCAVKHASESKTPEMELIRYISIQDINGMFVLPCNLPFHPF